MRDHKNHHQQHDSPHYNFWNKYHHADTYSPYVIYMKHIQICFKVFEARYDAIGDFFSIIRNTSCS